MALAYTAPTWTDGSGQGITASQLQALCNCVEGLVQGTDKAIHGISISGSVLTITYADGSIGTVSASGLKGISLISKTSTSGLVDTYTITYTDGSTSTFTITNGATGPAGPQGPQGATGAQGPAGADGTDGEDGFSPTANVEKTGSVATITITDAEGTTTATISDGADGADGEDGEDGVSVTGVALQSTSGKQKTYRMSFSDGTHFDYVVTDGADGQGGGDGDMKKSVYDTDNDGVVDSAETLNGLTASIAELNYTDGVTSNIQTQLNAKATTSQLDEWSSVASLTGGNYFSFSVASSLYDNNACDLFCSRFGVQVTSISVSARTSSTVTVVAEVSGAMSGDTAKLRFYK